MALMHRFVEGIAKPTRSPIHEQFDRAIRLAHLLGEDVDAQHMYFGSTEPRHGPLPARLASLIEERVRLRHAAGWLSANGVRVYTLPQWLLGTSQCRSGWSPRGLHVGLHGEGLPRIAVKDALNLKELGHQELAGVVLRPQRRSKLRQARLAAAAASLLHDLETILCAPASASDWLREMIEDPRSAESEALRIWNTFIADCSLPKSFRIPGRALSLGDLMILRDGFEGGRHRQSFAEQQPWAARILLRERDRDPEAFAPIDENPANGVPVAAKLICCGGDGDGNSCEKALRFTRTIARHRNRPAVDQLLGQDRGGTNRLLRSLLIEAHEKDGGELLSHIGGKAGRARRQIKRALEVYYAYRERSGTHDCAYELSVLVIRMMIRNAFDPRSLDPQMMASGLAAVSADCLAAFAAQRQSEFSIQVPDLEADTLDIGILALVAFLGRPRRPRLTAGQLVKFAEAASQRGIHSISTIKHRIDAGWPTPLGWSAQEHSTLTGASISPLTRITQLLDEGRRMRNCLQDGRYNRPAVLGRTALFSLRVDDESATLALKPNERGVNGKVWIDGWEIDQFRGPSNGEPSIACRHAADSLIQRLNDQCPRTVPEAEISRRQRIRAAMDQSRTFNDDVGTARERWTEIYVRLLPRGLASVSPSEIVDAYLREKVGHK